MVHLIYKITELVFIMSTQITAVFSGTARGTVPDLLLFIVSLKVFVNDLVEKVFGLSEA